MLAPAGTPQQVIDLRYREIVKIERMPKAKARELASGRERMGLRP
jgi:hypothetical protein